ncbi:hypothetical protein ACOWKN_06080, partial [Helicobacter pylori]
MRRVLKHHVCLCVLSTAVLAGLVLLTDQNKVYAAAQNCNGVANSNGDGIRSDNNSGRIECDGGSNGTGDRSGQLSGKRTIDMSGTGGKGVTNSGHPAVKVYKRADITISSELTITDKGSNNNPAIMVESGGKLMVNHVTMTNVHKGIVVSGGGSSVIVVKGSIGVRTDGGAVIEVKNGGKITLNEGVKVNGGGDNTGIEVNGTGGTVTLVGTNFSKVKTGIVFKGSKGGASVMGGAEGATINLTSGGTGIKMEGDGRANATVMNMTIQGSGGTGAEVKNGTLTVNMVTMTNMQTGVKVTNGFANVMNTTIQGSGGTGTGVEMSGNGTVTLSGGVKVMGFETGMKVTGSGMRNTVTGGVIQGSKIGVEVSESGVLTVNGEATIVVTESNGVGLKVTGNGRANVVGGEIKGSGGTGTGVEMSGEGTVRLDNVRISEFETGLMVSKGTLTMTKGSITGKGSGYGVYAMVGKEGKSLTIRGNSTIDFKGDGVGVGVLGEVKSVSLKDVTIKGEESGYVGSMGVYAMGVGTKEMTVRLEDVRISKVGMGVVMGQGKSLMIRGGSVDFTGA